MPLTLTAETAVLDEIDVVLMMQLQRYIDDDHDAEDHQVHDENEDRDEEEKEDDDENKDKSVDPEKDEDKDW